MPDRDYRLIIITIRTNQVATNPGPIFLKKNMSRMSELCPLIIFCFLSVLFFYAKGGKSQPESLMTLLDDLISNRSPRRSSGNLREQIVISQIDLLLAELQSKVVGNIAAQKFLFKAGRFGLPSFDNLKFSNNYIASYDNRLKHPVWSLEHLTDSLMKVYNIQRKRHTFFVDRTMHEYFRSAEIDYRFTGLDRGHLVPACDNVANARWVDQSYYLSNVVPMAPNINRGPWARLESYVTHVARHSKNIYIVTGTLYMPINPGYSSKTESMSYRMIGQNRVSVPTHMYKVFVSETHQGHLIMEAFLMPNDDKINRYTHLREFKIDIDQNLPEIEKNAGVTIFDALDRHRLLKPSTLQYGFDEYIQETLKRVSTSKQQKA